MVVTEEKLREAIVTTVPFAPPEEVQVDVCSDTWAEAEFEQIFLTHYGRIVAVLFRLTGNRAQAEELAGDVFWKIYQQPLPPDRDHNVGGWLYRVATRLGIDALRAQARRKHYEQAAGQAAYESGEASDDPLADVLRDEKRRRVHAVLAAMKPAQAQLLMLRQSGLSYQELAEIFGVKTNSIGTLLARAEADFEKRFRELYGAVK
jgi:RNA polymerase sigma-70 factor (ECF subfamily)